MRSTFSLLPYINRSKVRADGTTAVLCRITIDGKQTAISTGIYCRPEDWNGRKNEIKTIRENNRLREYLRLTEEAYAEILKSQGVVSAEMLKNHISLNNIHPTTLLQMGEWERERLKKHSEEIGSTSSYRASMYYQKYLTDFIASIGRKDIPLEEVTEDFGKSYKAHLKKCKNFGVSQTNHCLRWLNRLLYLAVDKEILRVNPCEDLEYETKPEARHRYISREEFRKILSTPMYDKRMELARRAFIFSSLTGLAYVDIKLLHPHHIGTNAEGRRYIRVNRKKTKVEAFIPLHPIAEQILSLYNTTDDEKPVFPLPNRDALWFEVHELGVTISETGAVTIPTAPVWMTQFEIADLFGVFSCDIRKATRVIYKNKELSEANTMRYIRQTDGISYDVYSLEMIIAIAFRICSRESILFRRFVISEISTTKKESPVTLFFSCSKGSKWYS